MADFINRAAEFMSDPWNMGSSFTGGLAKSLGLDNTGAITSAQESLESILTKSGEVSGQNRALFDNYMSQMQGLYGSGAASYSDAVKNLEDAIANYEDFAYTKDVNSFLDPAREQRVQQAMDAIEGAASAGGNRFSSNYLDKLAAKQQSLASDEWSKAFERYQQDRGNALQEWQTKQQKINNLGTLANLYGNDRTGLTTAIGEYFGNLANQNNADLQTYADITSNKADLETQKKSGVGALLGGGGAILAGMFGG